jgi:hypothetical protein
VAYAKEHTKCKELLASILSFWFYFSNSVILLGDAQSPTSLYAFSTFQPPPHTKNQGHGTLLVLFVIYMFGMGALRFKWEWWYLTSVQSALLGCCTWPLKRSEILGFHPLFQRSSGWGLFGLAIQRNPSHEVQVN